MNEQFKVLRRLAYKYLQIAQKERNARNLKLHKAVNDLHQIRPVVLIDELPWHEMDIDGELRAVCSDPVLREAEIYMRRIIYRDKYFPVDMIVKPYIPVHKVITSTGIGISIDERTLETDTGSDIQSHEYHDCLATQMDIERLQTPIISYNKTETERRYNLLGDALCGILPVKIVGLNHLSVCTWDDIARYRGVTNLLIDLAERPEFSHQIVSKLTDINCDVMKQYERLCLFEPDPSDLHCTPIATDHLPRCIKGDSLTLKDIWGRGMAQIFASVSKAMHEEYDIEYIKRTIGQCGLVYYGCCEPLDRKIDIIEKIPNLRKISITPWADVNTAAEAINHKYVLAAKPNPASVAVSRLDKDELKKELTMILNACKRNNCSCDIVLKDISSCGGNPENIFEWAKTAMDIVSG